MSPLSRRFYNATLILLASSALSPLGLALVSYSENFEDDAIGTVPTSTFYSAAGVTGQIFVTGSGEVLGTKSLKTSGVSAIELFATTGTSWDLCQGGSVSFAFNLATINSFSIGLRDGPGQSINSANYLTTSGTTLLAQTSAPGPNSDTETVGTITAGEWYNATISNIDCTNAKATFYVTGLGLDTAVTTDSIGSQSQFDQFDVQGTNAATVGLIDNIVLSNVNNPPPSALGSAATAAVTSLNGFDVDATGTTVIARTNLGDNVRTFSATFLGTELSSDSAQCGATDERVAAIATFVAYLDCVAGDPQQLKIRAPADLATEPDTSNSGCGNNEVCPTTITLEDSCVLFSGSNGLDDGTGDINDIIKHMKSTQHAPIDYSRFTDSRIVNADSHAFAMAYSTNTGGDLGVFAFTGADKTCDTFSVARYSTPTSGDIDSLCTWRNTAGTSFIGAADLEIPPTIMSVTFSLEDGPDTSLFLRPNLGAPITYSAYAGAESIACAESRLVFGFDNRVVVYDFGTNTVVMDKTHTGDGHNGVSITRDGEFTLVRSSPTLVTLYAIDNGTAIATLTIPSGTYHASALGTSGAQAWIATTAVIARYNISPFTNATCDQEVCGQPVPVATTAAPGLLAGQGAIVGASLGIGSFGGNLFMGVLLVGMVATGVGFATRSVPIALLGAVVGFLLGWAFGFFSTGVVFSVVVIVGVLGWLLMRGSASNG